MSHVHPHRQQTWTGVSTRLVAELDCRGRARQSGNESNGTISAVTLERRWSAQTATRAGCASSATVTSELTATAAAATDKRAKERPKLTKRLALRTTLARTYQRYYYGRAPAGQPYAPPRPAPPRHHPAWRREGTNQNCDHVILDHVHCWPRSPRWVAGIWCVVSCLVRVCLFV